LLLSISGLLNESQDEKKSMLVSRVSNAGSGESVASCSVQNPVLLQDYVQAVTIHSDYIAVDFTYGNSSTIEIICFTLGSLFYLYKNIVF
jgi:hypothetical protein